MSVVIPVLTEEAIDLQVNDAAVGVAPHMSIGTVETLEPDTPAYATITGTAMDPVLNLGIPQGEQGETGATGATPQLTIGTVSTLPAGSSATVTITGTDENPVLNLGIPQGAQGVQGIQGEPGYSPVRGTDYWTASDQQTVIDAAIAAVLAVYPAAEGVSF